MLSDDEELVDLCRCCDNGTFELDWTQVILGHRFCRNCGHLQYLHGR